MNSLLEREGLAGQVAFCWPANSCTNLAQFRHERAIHPAVGAPRSVYRSTHSQNRGGMVTCILTSSVAGAFSTRRIPTTEQRHETQHRLHRPVIAGMITFLSAPLST